MSTLPTQAEKPYVIGVSAAADNADGLVVSGLVDVSVSDNTSIAVSAGVTEAQGEPVDVRTFDWDISITHDFEWLGIELEAGQWGDSDEFSSTDLSLGLFRKSGPWRVSAGLIKRDMELTFRAEFNPEMEVRRDAVADGISAALSYTTESGAGVFFNARAFDYDPDLSRLSQTRLFRLLSPSSLTLSSALVDHSASLGLDWPVGEKLLSVTVSRDRTAVDAGDVNSLAVGWLTPFGARSDIEFGVGASHDEDDTQLFVSVLVLFYGGID